MILIPGEKRKIKDKIKEESEKYGPLDRKQKERIAHRVHKKVKRQIQLRAMAAVLGIGAVAGGVKLLGPGEQPKELPATESEKTQEALPESSTRKEFLDGIKVETPAIQAPVQEEKEAEEEKQIYAQVVEEYNKQYPDNQISEKDLGILKRKPQFITKRTNENGSIEYIDDFRVDVSKLGENEEIVYNNEDISVNNIYTVVNKNDGTIITSVGEIDYHIVDVDTKHIIGGTNEKEYVEGKNIKLGESEADKLKIYEELAQKYEDVIKQQSEQANNDMER